MSSLAEVFFDLVGELRGKRVRILDGAGLGRLAVSAVTDSDLPVIVATVLVAGSIVVIANVIVDLLYAVIDPRVRLA